MPTIAEFKKEVKNGKAVASRLLFAWLSDDQSREQLYADMIAHKEVLPFESRALVDDHVPPGNNAQGLDDDRPKSYHQTAYLVVHPDHVEEAYKNSKNNPLQWSHTPYNALGGTFMLALDKALDNTRSADPFRSPDEQRSYCYRLLEQLKPSFDAVATVAFRAGAMLPLKQRHFDLADLAETVAVNYVARLFGFRQADIGMLKAAAQKIGNGLMHVNVGQHFLTDAAALPLAKQALATVTQRAADLIDLYDQPVGKDQKDQWEDLEEELKNLQDYWFERPKGAQKEQALQAFKPLMQLMAKDCSGFSTTEKAIMVTGLVSGTITNLRAAVCIAIDQFFRLPIADLATIRTAASNAYQESRDALWNTKQSPPGPSELFRAYVEEALRVNPPPPFVPRRAAKDIVLTTGGQKISKNSLMVIAVGGGSWGTTQHTAAQTTACHFSRFDMGAKASVSEVPMTERNKNSPAACPFSKAFGGPPETLDPVSKRAEYLHSCIGKDMAMYSIAYTVRQILMLPGLTQSLDDKTGVAKGLTKRAGFICEAYPLEYEREKLLRQSPLQTVLQVKNPVPEHAAALRQVLQFGAPFIEKVIRDARHVHFASFLFLDNDSKLVLFTAYDGDFDAYIGHFAHEFGPLFDRFFSHIENGPPSPIAEHAFEFVQFLRRFQQPAVGGLFFSAYPEAQADQIAWQFNKDRQYDFFTLEGA